CSSRAPFRPRAACQPSQPRGALFLLTAPRHSWRVPDQERIGIPPDPNLKRVDEFQLVAALVANEVLAAESQAVKLRPTALATIESGMKTDAIAHEARLSAHQRDATEQDCGLNLELRFYYMVPRTCSKVTLFASSNRIAVQNR